MTRTRKHGELVEGCWPNGLATVEMYAPWDLKPEPPFRIQRWADAPPGWTRGEWRVHETLESAIEDFMRWPVERGMSAVLIDESFRCVLGWSGAEVVWVQMQSAVWYGVEASFRALEATGLYDPWSVLDWEVQAMVSAT